MNHLIIKWFRVYKVTLRNKGFFMVKEELSERHKDNSNCLLSLLWVLKLVTFTFSRILFTWNGTEGTLLTTFYLFTRIWNERYPYTYRKINHSYTSVAYKLFVSFQQSLTWRESSFWTVIDTIY